MPKFEIVAKFTIEIEQNHIDECNIAAADNDIDNYTIENVLEETLESAIEYDHEVKFVEIIAHEQVPE